MKTKSPPRARLTPIIGEPTMATIVRFQQRVLSTLAPDHTPEQFADAFTRLNHVRPPQGQIIGHGTQLAMERARATAVANIDRLKGLRTREIPTRQAIRASARALAKAEEKAAKAEAFKLAGFAMNERKRQRIEREKAAAAIKAKALADLRDLKYLRKHPLNVQVAHA